MRIAVLTVPHCPNSPVLQELSAEVLAGRGGVRVEGRVIDTMSGAERWGMPTDTPCSPPGRPTSDTIDALGRIRPGRRCVCQLTPSHAAKLLSSSLPRVADAIASTVSRAIGWCRVCCGATLRAVWRDRNAPG